MQAEKLKKYISWNLISLLGYFCSIVLIVFIIMYSLVSSQLHMRADLDKYFYHSLIHNVLLPYLAFYKIQISFIAAFLIAFIFEKNHYEENKEQGFQIFENSNNTYTELFITGLVLNLGPMYLFTMFIIIKTVKYLQFCGIN